MRRVNDKIRTMLVVICCAGTVACTSQLEKDEFRSVRADGTSVHFHINKPLESRGWNLIVWSYGKKGCTPVPKSDAA